MPAVDTLTETQLLTVVQIALHAGQAIMPFYHQSTLDIETKQDSTPLTAADLASHHSIVNALTQQFPNIEVLSEESAEIGWETRQHWSCYWLIDPLDGTKEFIKRNGEFTVNIALIVDNVPIAGVVYAPALGRCFFGMKDHGAWEFQQDSAKEPPSIDTILNVRQPLKRLSEPRKAVILASRSHITPGLAGFLSEFKDFHLREVGSSLKMCLLASGEADIYPRLGATHEWDIAAAHAILSAAGGCVYLHNSHSPLRYNTKPELENPWFIAYRPGWIEDTP
ncbi:3'(2'),5'-bisphosphate nucleotidase CysQ [Shewanella avicenniae]|nr:3'(2'),5'-bisphosphate nucleotidase CysQ [Shewanella avicenniae]